MNYSTYALLISYKLLRDHEWFIQNKNFLSIIDPVFENITKTIKPADKNIIIETLQYFKPCSEEWVNLINMIAHDTDESNKLLIKLMTVTNFVILQYIKESGSLNLLILEIQNFNKDFISSDLNNFLFMLFKLLYNIKADITNYSELTVGQKVWFDNYVLNLKNTIKEENIKTSNDLVISLLYFFYKWKFLYMASVKYYAIIEGLKVTVFLGLTVLTIGTFNETLILFYDTFKSYLFVKLFVSTIGLTYYKWKLLCLCTGTIISILASIEMVDLWIEMGLDENKQILEESIFDFFFDDQVAKIKQNLNSDFKPKV